LLLLLLLLLTFMIARCFAGLHLRLQDGRASRQLRYTW
jgi:hypothetical protein